MDCCLLYQSESTQGDAEEETEEIDKVASSVDGQAECGRTKNSRNLKKELGMQIQRT